MNSRRSIAEAESVSKLTELAFIFIPLSFVASLFSMQVDELNEGVSLYVFVLVAMAFVFIAYAIRLSIRCSQVVRYKQRMMAKVRNDSYLQPSQPIPTRQFVVWASKAIVATTWNSFKGFVVVTTPFVLVSAIVATILSPIVLLWLWGIHKGFSAVITVLLLVLDVILVYPIATTASGCLEVDPKRIVRGIKLNLDIQRKQKEKAKKREMGRLGIVDPEAIDVASSDEGDGNIDLRETSDQQLEARYDLNPHRVKRLC